jgi:hypothetical protein
MRWRLQLTSSLAAASQRAPSLAAQAQHAFLPQGYPSSVSPSYLRYSAWAASGAVLSSASGVLATSSLLVALGVSASTALPFSAATTWVLKDGLGQLGGVLYAAALGTSFDADPKRWRQVSALALDGAGVMEVCILALAPLHVLPFLPFAALANVARNVAWLSASATRAGLHSALARKGNLADITAKAGSQSTAAATLGTALGVGLSMAAPHAGAALALYLALAAGHQACVFSSLRAVVLPTLSGARLHLAWQRAVAGEAWGAPMRALLRTPEEVCALEHFLPWQPPLAPPHLHVVQRLREADAIADAAAFAVEGEEAPHHALVAGACGRVHIFLARSAGPERVLLAHLHAERAAWELAQLEPPARAALEARVAAVARARAWTQRLGAPLLAGLCDAGWRTSDPVLEGALGARFDFSRAEEDKGA